MAANEVRASEPPASVGPRAVIGSTVVVADDERLQRERLVQLLRSSGYVVESFEDGQAVVERVGRGGVDLVLLDVLMPRLSGLEACRVIKSIASETFLPVVLLTVRSDTQSRVEGLRIGADDYVSKPFGAGELLARIRVAMRHTAGAASQSSDATFKVGDLQVDLLRRHVAVGGREIHLTPTEYKLLTTLIRHAGKVVTHQQLLNDVWGPRHAEQGHYVRVYMAHLRHKLEAEPARPRYLQTEAGVGYRLVVD